MEMQNFKYSAFISYRHLDEKEAKWIHKTLEQYRLPAKVCKEYGLHKKLKQCFRDANGLAKPILDHAILEEMQQCKYMILVCSPNVLLDSEHIDDEVEMFRKLRGSEYIIPVIIDGSPDDPDPSKRCFPPAIVNSEHEYLGFNFNEQGGKKKAMLRVIATILGISADTLIMREQKRQRQQYMLFGAALACIVAVVAGLVWHYMPHRTYYVDYVVQYGVPVGVGEALTNQQRHNKSEYFEITTQNVFEGKNFLSTYEQYQVQYINARGAVVEFAYKSHTSDKVVNAIYSILPLDEYKVEYFSAAGKALVTFDYLNENTVADLKNPYNLSVPITLSADSETSGLGITDVAVIENKSEISRYEYEYTDGYVTKVLYERDGYGTATPDANGIYGKEYELDPTTGQIIAEYYLNADGERMVLPNGLYVKRYTYDENHLMVRLETQNAEGEGIYIDGQPPICQFTYDEQMNLVQISYMDAQGNLALDEAYVAVYVIEYQAASRWDAFFSNEGPLVSEIFYYGTDGELTISAAGCASYKVVYDERGNTIEVSYYGTGGALVFSNEGIAGLKRVYDACGQIIEESYYDMNEDLIFCNYGYAVYKAIYDKDGNVIEVSYYGTDGADGALVFSNEGIAGIKRVYDACGQIIEESYYDINKDLVLGNYGFAIYKAVYDERGNVIEKSYYGTDDNLSICDDGYAIYKKVYDERGNVIEESYCGTDGELTISAYGCATYKAVYDERGNTIEAFYYGTDGELTISAYGCAIYKAVYDERGNTIEASYYGTDGELTISAYGYATYKTVYDERGNTIEASYYGTDGELIISAYGCAAHKAVYDERGNMIEVSYYGTDGELTISTYGYAVYKAVYDERGNAIEESYYGTDGAFMTSAYGCAIIKSVYDERGNAIEKSYYDTDGELTISVYDCAIMKLVYDERGNVIEESYYDTEGVLVISAFGCAVIKQTYDVYGNKVETNYYDVNNLLIDCIRSIIVIDEVFQDSAAETMGLQNGDILIRYNDWDMSQYLDLTSKDVMIEDFAAALDESKLVSKWIVVLRYSLETGAYEPYEVMIDDVIIGVRFINQVVEQDMFSEIFDCMVALAE